MSEFVTISEAAVKRCPFTGWRPPAGGAGGGGGELGGFWAALDSRN